jgi:non-ribosomal peptide synthetase component F
MGRECMLASLDEVDGVKGLHRSAGRVLDWSGAVCRVSHGLAGGIVTRYVQCRFRPVADDVWGIEIEDERC